MTKFTPDPEYGEKQMAGSPNSRFGHDLPDLIGPGAVGRWLGMGYEDVEELAYAGVIPAHYIPTDDVFTSDPLIFDVEELCAWVRLLPRPINTRVAKKRKPTEHAAANPPGRNGRGRR